MSDRQKLELIKQVKAAYAKPIIDKVPKQTNKTLKLFTALVEIYLNDTDLKARVEAIVDDEHTEAREMIADFVMNRAIDAYTV